MNQIATSSGPIPLILIAFTIAISALAFLNETAMQRLMFFGPAVKQSGQWYRLVTHGFIHKDLFHIFFNLFTLYSFGDSVITIFENALGDAGSLAFLAFYLVAIVAAILPTYWKHKNDHSYYSLGASGAISAIIAFDALSEPGMQVIVYGIPVPGWAYLIGFIAISIWLGRNPNSMVNHSAHLYGAAFGLVVAIALGAVSGQAVIYNFLQGSAPIQNSGVAISDSTNNIGNWYEYEVREDGSVIFDTGYTDEDGSMSESQMGEFWGKKDYYYFRVGCYPTNNEYDRLIGEFALQPATANYDDAYTTDVFGDAQDFKLTLGTSKTNAYPTLIENVWLASTDNNNPPYSYIYFTPVELGVSTEFAAVLLSGEVELTANGKTIRFSWPASKGSEILDKLESAGCKSG